MSIQTKILLPPASARRVPFMGTGSKRPLSGPSLKISGAAPGLSGKTMSKRSNPQKSAWGFFQNNTLDARRSAEIPYISSVLCAERTEEHLAMYREDEEAVFWSTPKECAEKYFALLADEENRTRIAEAGRRRCIASGYLNDPVMRRILDALPDGNPDTDITEKSEPRSTQRLCEASFFGPQGQTPYPFAFFLALFVS